MTVHQTSIRTRHAGSTFDRGVALRAFTLMELLVVLVLLGFIAAMMVPRMIGNESREFRLVCDQVADLLTMYARRESLSTKPVGLLYDEQRHWLYMMEFDIDEESNLRDAMWQHDSTIRPVRLPDFVTLTDVRSDGDHVDISQWPLTTRPGQDRPAVTLSLRGPDNDVVTFHLPPYAVAPRRFGDNERSSPFASPIDLNAIGRSRGEW